MVPVAPFAVSTICPDAEPVVDGRNCTEIEQVEPTGRLPGMRQVVLYGKTVLFEPVRFVNCRGALPALVTVIVAVAVDVVPTVVLGNDTVVWLNPRLELELPELPELLDPDVDPVEVGPVTELLARSQPKANRRHTIDSLRAV